MRDPDKQFGDSWIDAISIAVGAAVIVVILLLVWYAVLP